MWAFHCSGFSCCSSWALEFGLNSCGAWAWLLLGMWYLPRPGIKSVSPALAGGFFTTEPPGKPHKNSWNPFSSAQIHITGLFNLGSQEMYGAQESDPTCSIVSAYVVSLQPQGCVPILGTPNIFTALFYHHWGHSQGAPMLVMPSHEVFLSMIFLPLMHMLFMGCRWTLLHFLTLCWICGSWEKQCALLIEKSIGVLCPLQIQRKKH